MIRLKQTINSYKMYRFFVILCLFVFFCNCAEKRHDTELIKNQIIFPKVSKQLLIDGNLNETFWKNAEPAKGFRVNSNPARIPDEETVVYLAYNESDFLIAFVCFEKNMKKLKNDIDTLGAKAWENDYCEVQVFSRPETPYYSPFMQRLDYMNANNKARTQRHFMVTPANVQGDGNIYKVGPHTAYITDDTWEGNWKSAVSMLKDRYIIEMSIPWTDIGGMPEPGHTFKLGFIRHCDETVREISRFNWYSGENIRVETFDPADFVQEHPLIFAPVTFEEKYAVLNRYIETSDPWKVERQMTEYELFITDNKAKHRTAHFYLGITGFLLPDSIKSQYDDETWAMEEDNFITELGRAGSYGPFLPGFLNQKGEAALDSLYNQYGMKFGFHGSIDARKANDAGAKFLRPRGTAAFFDPVYIEMKNRMLENWLKKYGKKTWLFDVRGQDEPFNQIATLRMPGTYEMVNQELKKEYGVDMGVPVGIPGTPYQDQEIDASSRLVPDHSAALSRIATFRWLNKRFYEVARGEYGIVKKYAPNVLYQAYNRNSVADLDFLDQSLIYDVTDYFSADPYPSFCIYVYGTARSRYHVGFTSKMVTDLAVGKPTQMIIQGCEMIQRLSTTENIREWTSQAAKAGVTMLDWWGNPRLHYPSVYKEMIRLSKLWRDLPVLDIPETADIAVLFSDDSRAAAGDEGLHAHYTLHVLLGEKLGAWYRFTSENHVRRGLQNLDDAKLLIAPQLAYISKEFAQKLIKCVEDGATLVVLDPDALSYDIEIGSLSVERMQLLGISDCEKREAHMLTASPEAQKRFVSAATLALCPMRNMGNVSNARILKVPAGDDILYKYDDGSPAVFSHKLGKGEVIVFGAMPFYDSEFALNPQGWDYFFASLLDELNIERDLPIWKFMFPVKGGEVETIELLMSRK